MSDFTEMEILNRHLAATAFGLPVEYLQPERSNYALAKLQSEHYEFQVETAIANLFRRELQEVLAEIERQSLQETLVNIEVAIAKRRILEKIHKRRKLQELQEMIARG